MIQAHYIYCVFIWPCCVTYGILVPQPRIKPLHFELRVLRGGAGWGGAGVAQASSTNIPDSWGGSMPGVSAKHSLYIS